MPKIQQPLLFYWEWSVFDVDADASHVKESRGIFLLKWKEAQSLVRQI